MLPLVGLELAIRVAGPILPGSYATGEFQSRHPVYGRFHRAGFDGWMKTSEYTARVTTNSLGLRGPEREYTKPAGTRRVLFLGDSFIEAASVDEHEGVVARVEAALSVDGARYEMLNSGVGGWGQHQQLSFLLHEGVRYRPDVVVVMLYLGNDLVDSSWELQGRPRRPTEPYWVLDDSGGLTALDVHAPRSSPGPLEVPFLEDSMLWYAFKTGPLSTITGRDGMDEADDGWKARFMKPFSTKASNEVDHAWRTMIALLNRLAREADRHGATPLVVAIPAMFQVYDDDWSRLLAENQLKRIDWSQDQPNRILAREAGRIRAPILDLLPAFRAAALTNPPLYYPRDRHWTPAGHDVASREIAAFLRTNGAPK